MSLLKIEQLYDKYYIDEECFNNPKVIEHHEKFKNIWLDLDQERKEEDYPINKYIGIYKHESMNIITTGIPFLIYIDEVHVGYFNVYIVNHCMHSYGYLYISIALFEKYRNKSIMTRHFDNLISAVETSYTNHFYNTIMIFSKNPILQKIIKRSKHNFTMIENTNNECFKYEIQGIDKQ